MGEAMPGKKTWIITTSEDRSIREIVTELRKAGFAVGEVHDQIHSISGDADESVARKVRSIRGVVDVSPDRPIDIGPPGSSDSW
jgi:hypothetical protein